MSKFDLKPIQKNKTSKELVYDELKSAILHGTIPKDELITEISLSKSFDVSRTPVRESLAELTKEGLLEHEQRKGFKVRHISENEKEQIIYLRKSMEKEGVRKLAPIITEEQIQELDDILSEQEDAAQNDDRLRNIELDQMFHKTILEFAEQNMFKKIFIDLHNLTRVIGHEALMKPGRMEEVIKEHRAILEGLQEQDEHIAMDKLDYHLSNTETVVKNIK
ncbi:GntR family transcriptional regulator [Alkalibacillus almallahensis]|uniref:GntR family transcriptional regulator n=1 Tax=Alkalibacillus almallahensis TaxID=1379154 RepID=UPI001421A994|nr:GntR family transcriptional regulator [Alkalibacillus almallahensis]NIK11494.1 DNA-binding GntR family transcriptional regulator [Alkalibacillus almallahensis]